MPALNIIENNDRIIEINHHLVHLNTHHYNDWINPRDLLNTFLYHHGSPAGSGGHHPGSPTQAGHHSFSHINDTHLGNTTPVLPPHPGHPGLIGDDTEEESLIVVYALFLPLLAALIFILIVALYVRRMRRSSSMQNVTLQNEAYEFTLEQMKSRSTTHNNQYSNNNNSKQMKDSSLSSASVNSSSSSKGKSPSNKKTTLTRSVSSSAFSHHIDASGSNNSKYCYYNGSYQVEAYHKRWNNTGFLSSANHSSGSFDEEADAEADVTDSSKTAEVIPYGNSNDVVPSSPNVHITITSETTQQGRNNKSLKTISGRLISVLNVPKRIKQNSIEKKRFNIYTIPFETREQLKQIYVY